MTPHTEFLLVAVLLHAGLLAALFSRGVARELPLFTALIGFYLVRSILLYTLFGRIDEDAYGLWFNSLGLLDLVLQIVVVWELFRKTRLPTGGSPTIEHVTWFALLLLVSAAAAWAISFAVPSSSHLPMDRGVLFTGALMLLTALSGISKARPVLPRRILFGFGVFGFTSVVSQIGRTLAAFHRGVKSFVWWSWIDAVAYLVIVIFWTAVIIAGATRSALRKPKIVVN